LLATISFLAELGGSINHHTPLTYYRIRCGEMFTLAGPDVVLCPACGGPPEAVARSIEGEQVGPALTVLADMDSAPAPVAVKDSSDGWQIGDVILDLYVVKPVYEGGEKKPRHEGGGMGVVYVSTTAAGRLTWP
jgi:hypothetical protein